MANQIPLLENLEKKDIQELIDACVNFDAKKILGPDYEDVISYNIPRLKLFWKNKVEFEKDIRFITGARSIVEANKVLERRLLTSSDKQIESNVPDRVAREQQELERQERERQISETKKKAEDEVKRSIEKKEEEYKKNQQNEKIRKAFEEKIKSQKEIQDSLKGKKIYAKVEAEKPPPLPDENTQKFIDEARNHPAAFEKELTENIRAKLDQTLSGKISSEEIDVIAKKTAYDAINAINNPQVQSDINNQTAILNSLSNNKDVITKTIGNPQTEILIKEASSELAFFKNSTEFSKGILSSVNENLAISVFGIDPKNLKVSFFESPIQGQTHDISLDQLSQGYQNLLGSQSEFFGNFSSIGRDQAQGYILGQARTFLDAQIANLPSDSALAGFYNSKFGQQILSFVGLEKYTPLSGNFWGGFIQQIPGASTFFEGLGSTLGIDFGITAIAPASVAVEGTIAAGGVVAAEATAGVAAGTAAATASTAVAGAAGGATTGIAAGAAAGATVGAPLGPVALITAALGAIVSWIGSKIDWTKVKKALPVIFAGIFGLGAAVFVGPIVGVAVGLGTFGVMSVARGPGGLSVAGIGLATALLLRRLAKGFFDVTVKPLIIFLLVAPVVIAIILFIINSGAYVVPPSDTTLGSTNAFVDVKKVVSPGGSFENSDIPLKITYTITVTAKKGPLTNITFKDICQVITAKGTTSCPSQSPTNVPTEISPSSPYSYSYDVVYSGDNYIDSLVINTLTVSAYTAEGQKDTVTSASVKIGSPPDSCPSNAWPIAGGVGLNQVTQGPSAPNCSHASLKNAIDIGVDGETIIAVHSGIATVGQDSCVGKYIKITSVCGSSPFTTLYGHLGVVTVKNGQAVTLGQTLGITDNTGTCTSGPHLHFEFQSVNIPVVQKPYLVRDIPARCCTRTSCNP